MITLCERNPRRNRSRLSTSDSANETETDDGNQGHIGGQGGVVVEEEGGEGEDHADRWSSTGFFFSVS